MSVLDRSEKKPHMERNMFLDGAMDIQRYDVLKYPLIHKLNERGLGNFWRPEEVDIAKDAADFKNLEFKEQHIFTSNLKRQITLDSLQGRAPAEAFLPFVSIPELEFFVCLWTEQECVHSLSYTHVIKNVYADPSEVFDGIMDIAEIVDCAKDISRDYDDLIEYGKYYDLLGEGTHKVNDHDVKISKFELKRRIWRALHAVNCLESIRFYASFVTSWHPAEHKKVMEGNAKIIKFIARDENVHMAATQFLIKTLPKEDDDFARIEREEQDYVTKIFTDAVEQEKTWVSYLFQYGSLVGLNADMLNHYLEWLATDRMRAVGLESPYAPGRTNPLPWTQKWISGKEVQVAPQETEITQYVIGGVKNDVDEDTFKDFQL